MTTLISNPIWGAIGALGTLLAIFASIVMFRKQKIRRDLVLREIKITPLSIDSKFRVKGKLRILYDEAEVENLSLIEFRIRNEGNKGITHEDCKQHLTISIGKPSTRILYFDITETNPVIFEPKITLSENRLELSFVLINEGWDFAIQLLTNELVNDNEILPVGMILDGKFEKKKYLLSWQRTMNSEVVQVLKNLYLETLIPITISWLIIWVPLYFFGVKLFGLIFTPITEVKAFAIGFLIINVIFPAVLIVIWLLLISFELAFRWLRKILKR